MVDASSTSMMQDREACTFNVCKCKRVFWVEAEKIALKVAFYFKRKYQIAGRKGWSMCLELFTCLNSLVPSLKPETGDRAKSSNSNKENLGGTQLRMMGVCLNVSASSLGLRWLIAGEWALLF